MFPERSLEDPGLAAARRAVDVILKAHEPYPALVVDLRWNLVAANAAALPLLDGVDPELLTPQVNVMRASLHPDRKSTRLNSSHSSISYAVFCLKKKINNTHK